MSFLGKPSTAGHILTWDGAKQVFQAAPPPVDATVVQGEWRRSVDRTQQRRSYEDVLLRLQAGFTTGHLYDDPRTTMPTRSTSRARIGLVNNNTSTFTSYAFSTAVLNPNSTPVHLVNTATSFTQGSFISHFNDDSSLGPTGGYIFGGTGGRFRENPAGGLITLDSVGAGYGRLPFFDGRHMWTLSNTEVRRLTGFFGTAGSYALDPTVYGSHSSTFSRASCYATDGLFTYMLTFAGKLYKINQLTLAVTSATVSGQCLSYDGKYLWIGQSPDTMRAYNPATLTLVSSHILPAIDGSGLTGNMLETVYDGQYIWVMIATSFSNQDVFMRFDPVTKRVVSGTAGGANGKYADFRVIPGDRVPAIMTYYKETQSGFRALVCSRELTDSAVGSLDITNSLVLATGAGALGVSGTYTLPERVPDSYTFYVKRDGGSLTVNTTDGSTIDGAATNVFPTNLETRTFVRHGGNWVRIS